MQRHGVVSQLLSSIPHVRHHFQHFEVIIVIILERLQLRIGRSGFCNQI